MSAERQPPSSATGLQPAHAETPPSSTRPPSAENPTREPLTEGTAKAELIRAKKRVRGLQLTIEGCLTPASYAGNTQEQRMTALNNLLAIRQILFDDMFALAGDPIFTRNQSLAIELEKIHADMQALFTNNLPAIEKMLRGETTATTAPASTRPVVTPSPTVETRAAVSTKPAVSPSAKSGSSVIVRTPESRQLLERSAAVRINEAWGELLRLETPSNKEPATQLMTKPYDSRSQNTHDAGILPLVKEFFPDDLKEWEMRRDIFDAFIKGCEGEGSRNQEPIVQLGWNKAVGAREKVTGQISIERLRSFALNPRFNGLVEIAKRLFDGPLEYHVKKDETDPEGWILVDEDGPGVITLMANFSRDGNRGASGTPPASEGGKSFEELLAFEYVKEIQKKHAAGEKLSQYELDIVRLGIKAFDRSEDLNYCADLDVVQFFVVVSELRLRNYAKYYENYAKTADPTFDITPIAYHSPLAEIGYKLRGYGYIPSRLAMLWQVLRYPKEGGRFVRKVSISVDLDRERRVVSRDNKGKIYKVSDWDGEYLPIQLDQKKEDKSHQVEEAILVRNLLDLSLTKFARDFEPVHVTEDLMVFPYVWDIIFAKESGFKEMTFSQYNESFGAWMNFIEKMSHPESPNATQITDTFNELASTLAKLKGMLAVMDGTEKGEVFIKVLQQLVLRFLKVVYDQYDVRTQSMSLYERIKNSSFNPKDYFFKQLEKAVKAQDTLHPAIKGFMLELCKKYRGWIRYNLFSPIRDDKVAPSVTLELPFIGRVPLPGEWIRYGRLVESYVATPKKEQAQTK